jgi:hypothetical protein
VRCSCGKIQGSLEGWHALEIVFVCGRDGRCAGKDECGVGDGDEPAKPVEPVKFCRSTKPRGNALEIER